MWPSNPDIDLCYGNESSYHKKKVYYKVLKGWVGCFVRGWHFEQRLKIYVDSIETALCLTYYILCIYPIGKGRPKKIKKVNYQPEIKKIYSPNRPNYQFFFFLLRSTELVEPVWEMNTWKIKKNVIFILYKKISKDSFITYFLNV